MKLNFKKEKIIHYKKIDSGFNIEPSFHWRMLFYFGLVILLAFTLASLYLYSRLDKSDVALNTNDNEVQTKIFDMDSIQNIENYFTKKKQNFDVLQTTRPIVSDPLLYK